MRAWTLGYGPAYEQAIRMPGNAKQPGGYAFRTADEAFDYAETHAKVSRYQPYEMEIPGEFDACTRWTDEECYVLTVEAPLVNPDTGAPA